MHLRSRALRGAAIAVFMLFSAFAAVAQDPQTIDYDAWDQLVDRVDDVLDAGRADETALARLRSEAVAFRDQFDARQGAENDQVARLRSQLEALGPPPAEGESEQPEVASRRDELTARIATANAPAIRASEAFAQANVLVSQIDAELRERSARETLSRYPLPVNPLNWVEPIAEVRTVVLEVPQEIFAKLNDPAQRAAIMGNIPSAALSLIGGTVLLFFSRRWTHMIARRVNAAPNRVVRRISRLMIVVAQLALPWLGLVLLLGGLQLTGILGTTGSSLLLATATFVFALILTTWMVLQFFPGDGSGESPLRITRSRVFRARRMAFILAVMLSLHSGVQVMIDRLNLDRVTGAYIGAVLSLIAAIALYRMGQLFRRSISEDTDLPENERVFSDGVISVLGSIGMLVSVVAVLAGVAGYLPLSERLIFASTSNFFLFGVLALIQRAVREFYALAITGGRDTRADDSLFPTLFGAILLLASLPVIALLWGARVTELTEIWEQIQDGMTVGDVRISPAILLKFLGAFVVGYTITRLVQGGLRNTVLPKTRLDPGARNALVSGIGYVGVFLTGIWAFAVAGINLSSLAIFASALAVGIGFGLQNIASNFVSGIILLVERPVSEGDWIEVGGNMGIVKKISVRATRIEKFDRTDLIIPNSDLVSGTVTNWTSGSNMGRIIVPVSVAYGTDTRHVETVLTEIANAHPMVSISSPPMVLFNGFGADGLNFEIRAILQDVNFSLAVMSEMNHEIARRFTEEGFEIPFAQRDIWLRNPEALAVATAKRGDAGRGGASENRSFMAEPAESMPGADSDGE